MALVSDHSYGGQGANFTDLLTTIQQLPPEERKRVLQDAGFGSIDELLNLYNSNIYVRRHDTLGTDYPEYHARQVLLLYVPPVVLLLGTFGNLFSFIILARSMTKISTYCYLAVLAIMDLLVLYIGLLRLWIGQFTTDIQDLSGGLCKGVMFLGYVCSDSSVWLIIAVTVERFIAVCFPLKAPRMCNLQRARIVIVSLILVICSIHFHFFWTVDLIYIKSNGTSYPWCKAGDNHKALVYEIWPWIDAAIYSFIPFVLITILNTLIIRKVLSARKRRSQLQQAAYPPIVNLNGNISLTKRSAKTSGEGSKKLTCMLLTVSFTFMLTTLPLNLTSILSAFYMSRPYTEHDYEALDAYTEEHEETYVRFMLARTVVELLMYVNHSINFFLYCATGRKFRRQFKSILCITCRRIRDFKMARNLSKKSTSTSVCMTRFTSTYSPRSLVVDCEHRFIQRGGACL